jgi:hypothetical protein
MMHCPRPLYVTVDPETLQTPAPQVEQSFRVK